MQISRTDRVRNEQVLRIINEERKMRILQKVEGMKANWIGHVWVGTDF